ncbi:flagellar protein FliT [Nitrosomonas sp. PY1]|uniref:flagellar protein FliT n=1 Tax=Nitrosomonas sp. PY1 TaxID=1803906 RepID=UPI001FC877CB|nr:flagellar protein FliT [Nitrosomonas sp. PY1]GKS68295.1 flagellar protein FliT [Nitrosomonas sp. PY1]
MTSAETIMIYEAILAITRQMLSAARNNQWNELIILEKECRSLTDKLINNDPQPIFEEDLLKNKIRIIQEILDDDAQIRAITQPWMEKLQYMLNTTDHSHRIQQAYHSVDNI